MVLKLDSGVVQVWRDPFSLQFGVEPVRTVLREVSNAEERMIAALNTGVSRSGLAMIATDAGAGEREVAGLLKRLDRLLVRPKPPASEGRVAIVGQGPTVDQLATMLTIAGARVTAGTSVPEDDCEFGVTIGHYVLDPESYGHWLRRDVPHFAVTFGDAAITVGPLVEPGVTACLYCLEHYRRDADASWAAIASQLWGRSSESETPIASTDVAARIARAVLLRLGGTLPKAAISLSLDAHTGETTSRTWLPHPDCGCIGMAIPSNGSGPASAAPREIGSVRGRVRPRTPAVASGRE
jgi:bacteriocin biosynthesis cyclodehydratase domain-containing protein